MNEQWRRVSAADEFGFIDGVSDIKNRDNVVIAESVPDRYAHLILAAPMLLAAATLYEATYVTTQHHPTPGEEAICMNAISAAIAAAEGRSR